MNILDDAALNQLKKDIENNMEYYAQYKDPWVQNFVEGLIDKDLLQDDILILSNDSSDDTENAINFYEKNKNLSTTLASSNHYWTTLAHTKYYKYMQTRWPVDEKMKPSNVAERYFFSATNQKSRARHGLTRLWWIAHLTYDDSNQEDPYYYTRVATEDQELYNLIMETKHIAQNKKALFAMLDVFLYIFQLQENGEIGKFHKRNFYRDTMKQINLIGSVSVWDMLTKEEAKEKLINFVVKYLGLEKKKYTVANL